MRIAHAGWDLILRPDLGGSIASFRRHGVDILRPTPAAADHPLATACFPLVPYANRIANGRFQVEGEAHVLPRNVAGQDHPLHGVGWLSAWSVAAAGDRHIALTHRHDGGADWPWAYAADQRFTLDDDGLHIALSITNADPRPMPVSLGLHPYFGAGHVTALRFTADGVWLADTAMLPTGHVGVDRLGDWAAGETIARQALIDNCYTGWSGSATIVRDDGDLMLTGSGTPFLHLFMPPGEGFFCAEPVTAMPDAVNRTTPSLLASGETRAMAMSITAAR